MASHRNFVKKQIAVDSVSWTPVVASINCSGLNLKNSQNVDLRTRTDGADPATQDLIPAGVNEGIVVASDGLAGGWYGSVAGSRFLAGDTIIFLQAASGTGPVLATFVR
jgi:hypothetical protein